MKMWRNNKLFTSLNVINGKSSPYVSKGIIRHYNYRLDPKLGPGIVAIIIIPCIFHACTTMLSLSWYSKTKEAFNQPRYGILYNCKCSQIIGCHNNWIIMNIFDYGRDKEYYKHTNKTILDSIVMNMYLIIMEGDCGAIGAYDSICHCSYIIKISSSPYTL